MSISGRIHDTFESWQAEWKDRLRGWFASWVNKGINSLIDEIEPTTSLKVEAILQNIRDDENTPPELRDLLNAITAPGHPLPLLLVIPLAALMLIPTVTAISQPLGNILRQKQERLFKSFRLDPSTITRIWLRDKATYEQLWKDLEDQGWSADRIAVAKELAKIIPPLPDMVRFADFSAFDPEVIEQWREFYSAPSWITEPLALLGITNEPPFDWGNKYWFSHWVQPGRYELGEIYRRGLLGTPLIGQDEIGGGTTEGEAERLVKLAYKTMGYSAFWQQKLLELTREVPTRVDIRRWWDMRTIDEGRLRELYQRQGYFGKDLEDYVLWTKVYVAFPDLIARWTNGWITEDAVRAELIGLGMPPIRVEEMIETKKKAVEAAQVEEGKALTKSEIYKGVKTGTITRDQGIDLLMDLNYNYSQAEYLLDINVGVLEGSPDTYDDFKDLTTKYKRAIGREEIPMPEEIKQAGDEVIRITKDIEALQGEIKAEEDKLIPDEVLPEEATARLDELRVMLHRAEAELFEAQTKYNSLVARWRHGR